MLQALCLTLWRKRKDVADANWTNYLGGETKDLLKSIFEDSVIQLVAFMPMMLHDILYQCRLTLNLILAQFSKSQQGSEGDDIDSSTRSTAPFFPE
jgi:hypothetical protein